MQTIGAKVSGHRSARFVDFTKIYLDPPPGYENPVDYVGQMSRDGMTVAGMWSLAEMNGTFEMHREKGVAEREEAGTAETVPASGMPF